MNVPPKLARINLDGTDPKILYNFTTSKKPESLTLDIENQMVYWSTSNKASVSFLIFSLRILIAF